ncbi:unnamed protein product [Mytilus coruscus]|uniref:Ig-like domain-containing protein n=1 Tax=Mytilus coruscus TaxID=42192 RepID=A0A6J8EUU4_MYTCO|nr:unnamed protein product [Mytilus coruscus]
MSDNCIDRMRDLEELNYEDPNASQTDGIFQKEIYADTGSTVTLSCQISPESSTQSWRKEFLVLTRGFDINRNVDGHERLTIIINNRFYNLKIYNLTEHDFGTYVCETQQVISITEEVTKLIHSGIGQNFYIGLFATGFAVLCLSVGCSYFLNKFLRRNERNSVDNENQDVLQGNGRNNDTESDSTLRENDNASSHYETINENEIMSEMSHRTISKSLSNLSRVTNKVQSSQQDNSYLDGINEENTYLDVIEEEQTYLDVIEDTNKQKVDQKYEMKGNEDNVNIRSSPLREERNSSTFIFLTKNNDEDKSNTINKECPVTIETNNFEDCITSHNSISVASSSSEQSTCESILEIGPQECKRSNQYVSLNVNDMEYLHIYSTPGQ